LRSHEFARDVLAQFVAARFDEWYQDTPLDFALLQMADGYILIFGNSDSPERKITCSVMRIDPGVSQAILSALLTQRTHSLNSAADSW
jgi:hypothetical protein